MVAMTFDKPFWRYSSRNVSTQVRHPKSHFTKERVLNMWASLHTCEEIAEALSIADRTVRQYLRRARVAKDPRAAYRSRLSHRREVQAEKRRRQIKSLYQGGMEIKDIAKVVGCHERLVQMRIKENGGGNNV